MTREGYTFTGWDNDNTSVDGTLGTTITYTATYSAIPRSEVSYTLEMSDDMLRLPTEETHTLTVETTPYAGMKQSKFTWSVDDPETVTILSEAEDGSSVEIKGVKPGSTTVRVTDGNESAACSVTVGERTFTITWVTDAENNLSVTSALIALVLRPSFRTRAIVSGSMLSSTSLCRS
mgnify:CR=1 FL=1